jgi:hypothetical protein
MEKWKNDFVMGRCGALDNWKLMKFRSQGFILVIETNWDLSAHKFIWKVIMPWKVKKFI